MMNVDDVKVRCAWPGSDPLYVAYHDEEWGVPEHDDQRLFEKIILDGAQAGLSWITILRKRENYRKAFGGFDPEIIARYGKSDIERLMEDAGIIRNRQKIESAVTNAKGFLKLKAEGISFNDFLWQFTNHKTIRSKHRTGNSLPAESEESRRMSRALKERGFKFVGPTICYAFMQAIGMVNDHTVECFRYSEVGK